MESPQDNDTMPLKDGFNFTPVFKGVRVRMRISDSDLALASRRGLYFRGWVTDLDTGIKYDVYGDQIFQNRLHV
jgi:hypothetical protein